MSLLPKLYIYLMISFFFLGLNITNGQMPLRPYEQIVFQGVQPIWYETIFHPDLISNLNNGYNKFDHSLHNVISPIIHEGYIYILYNVMHQVTNFGAYIEKRNLHTGELIWQTKYDVQDLAYPEMPYRFFMNEQDELIVLGHRRSRESTTIFCLIEDLTRLTYRKYDTNSGLLLEFNTPENSDERGASMWVSQYKQYHYSNIFYTENENEFIYTERLLDNMGGINIYRINQEGHQISELTKIQLGIPQTTHNLHQISVDTFFYFELDEDLKNGQFKFFDQNFNLLDTLNLDTLPTTVRSNSYTAVYKFDKEYVILVNILNPDDYLNFKITFMVYGLDGKLIDFITPPSKYNPNIWVSYLTKRKKLLCSVTYVKYPYKDIRAIFLGSDMEGSSIPLSTFYGVDSFRIIAITNVIELDEDKILFEAIEIDLYTPNPIPNVVRFDYNAKARSILVFDAKSIGLGTVSTKETLANSKQLKISPNPTVEQVDIHFSEQQRGMLYISDATGRLCMQKEISSAENVSLNVSAFQAGIYFVNFVSTATKGVNAIGKFVKVE